jgi:hypothetical protein
MKQVFGGTDLRPQKDLEVMAERLKESGLKVNESKT